MKIHAPQVRSSYETPILVRVMRIYAGMSVVFGVIGAVFTFSESLPVAVLCIVGGIGQAVICLGLGQCVDFLGRSAHNTGVVADQVEREHYKALQSARNLGGDYGARSSSE